MRFLWAAIAILSFLAPIAAAEDGAPSHAKLTRLGLDSLRVVSDEQGDRVRGGHFIFLTWTVHQEAGTVMPAPIGDTVSFGTPLTTQPPNVGPLIFSPPTAPVNDVIVGPTTITTITSDTDFTTIAGNSADVGPLLPPGSFGSFPAFPSFSFSFSFP